MFDAGVTPQSRYASEMDRSTSGCAQAPATHEKEEEERQWRRRELEDCVDGRLGRLRSFDASAMLGSHDFFRISMSNSLSISPTPIKSDINVWQLPSSAEAPGSLCETEVAAVHKRAGAEAARHAVAPPNHDENGARGAVMRIKNCREIDFTVDFSDRKGKRALGSTIATCSASDIVEHTAVCKARTKRRTSWRKKMWKLKSVPAA
ncbi:hypothetical protein ABB37_09832 [Leptomonas pyrrhocoris]|uniref:Uncharacterized protein n=1 Tax=Leptomonas pyrrhocoris TaxID=157538 RepID=A0A0M9FPX6_LEPPY|nr:hypothetical protein ABB37_09832 [Leptomonas pyrrhocoris]KPA73519.1 hypothetical protein ABB37_09832 [Leptomonas pyrrhocoris]|eukprot:XP_015651958.1 hypothetical protein ABB37_09832 [Leptomonas pyrrhocoris]